MTKVVISWPGFTGYMGPCFKALAEQCALRVFVEPSAYEQQFDEGTMAGVPFRRVTVPDIPAVVDEVREFSPDLTLVCGWRTPLARALARAEFSGRKVLAFDMPWEWTLRKIVARWALWPRLRHFDAAFVPGRRCARYARWLGFSRERLITGVDPSGWERFSSVRGGSAASGFLFAGRFSAEKGLDVLLAAYARYRATAESPWGLDLVGCGDALPSPLPEGVRVLGFVPPAEMPRVMGGHACLVLPSRWEPWGVVAAEAMGAGLLTVLSDRCGIVDDIRPTRVVRHGRVDELADALCRVARMTEEERSAEARRTASEVAHYSAAEWARRLLSCEPDGMRTVDRLLRERGFVAADEVWVHGMWTLDKWMRCVCAKLRGRRLVRMLHGSLSPVSLERQGKWKKRLVKPVERILFALSDRIVATGPWEVAWARAWGLRGELDVIDLRQFFRLDAAREDGRREADGSLHVLYLGRRHPLKGVQFLERAVAESNRALELRIVSDHGGAELERDWDWCDVLCLPTLSENFGLVVAEALERGKRVVTTDGAPAWDPDAWGEAAAEPWRKRVVYLRGYRDGTDAERVRLLKDALGTPPPTAQPITTAH